MRRLLTFLPIAVPLVLAAAAWTGCREDKAPARPSGGTTVESTSTSPGQPLRKPRNIGSSTLSHGGPQTPPGEGATYRDPMIDSVEDPVQVKGRAGESARSTPGDRLGQEGRPAQ